MPKRRIIYSLRVHLALQQAGFKAKLQMQNPNKPEFACWVYDWSEAFQLALDAIMEGGAVRG